MECQEGRKEVGRALPYPICLLKAMENLQRAKQGHFHIKKVTLVHRVEDGGKASSTGREDSWEDRSNNASCRRAWDVSSCLGIMSCSLRTSICLYLEILYLVEDE